MKESREEMVKRITDEVTRRIAEDRASRPVLVQNNDRRFTCRSIERERAGHVYRTQHPYVGIELIKSIR